MYECAICQSLNHASRTHCQYCGTIPSHYSMLGKPARVLENENVWPHLINVSAAEGAVRAEQHHATRANLKTVELDYYAENDD